MIGFIKSITPRILQNSIRHVISKLKLRKSFSDNYNRFKKYSFGNIGNIDSQEQLEARITKAYHSLEKGFSYNEIRLGFGVNILKELLDLLKLYDSLGYSRNSHCYQTALSNLNEYIKLHEINNYDVSNLKREILSMGQTEESLGGAVLLNKEDIIRKSSIDFKEFSFSRHSVRDFSNEPVDLEKLKEALKIAQNTPSACNRQGWKVRVISSSTAKDILQSNQNGNRGFGEVIDKYILVTTDIQYFAKPRELNQPYIDGGMYSMNLLYALHYVGLATVSLSAALTPKQEKTIRQALNITDAENLILFIGVGNYKTEFKIPRSARREPKYEII